MTRFLKKNGSKIRCSRIGCNKFAIRRCVGVESYKCGLPLCEDEGSRCDFHNQKSIESNPSSGSDDYGMS